MLGWQERDLRAYEPRPLAQAYPAYLAWSALFGTCSGVALAMLANLEEWGGYCGRVAGALATRYDLAERSCIRPGQSLDHRPPVRDHFLGLEAPVERQWGPNGPAPGSRRPQGRALPGRSTPVSEAGARDAAKS